MKKTLLALFLVSGSVLTGCGGVDAPQPELSSPSEGRTYILKYAGDERAEAMAMGGPIGGDTPTDHCEVSVVCRDEQDEPSCEYLGICDPVITAEYCRQLVQANCPIHP